MDFPGAPSGTEPTCQSRRHRFNPWVRKIPWTNEWQPVPVILPGKSHGPRSLVGYSPWGLKELGTTEQAHTPPGQQLCRVDVIISIVQMRKWSLREVV